MISILLRPHLERTKALGWRKKTYYSNKVSEGFWFHLATVDLRQSSDIHEIVVKEFLKGAKICNDYSNLTETEDKIYYYLY